jgi:ribosomal protein L21E
VVVLNVKPTGSVVGLTENCVTVLLTVGVKEADLPTSMGGGAGVPYDRFVGAAGLTVIERAKLVLPVTLDAVIV